MDAFRIQGGSRLHGEISIDGSKNASLPLMAASILAGETVTLRRVPDLSDIRNMARLLEAVGVRGRGTHGTITLEASEGDAIRADYDIVRTMRASISVLGPLLARRGHAEVSMPGGCVFGARPVDLHLHGLRALGADIRLEGGYIVAHAERLRGATIFLGGPFGSTVLGTANVMSAATLAEGTTIIESAACEPEIVDLAALLNKMGARIRGAGTPRVIVEGVDALGGADHAVMPDRIVAGTYAIAAAMTNGDVTLRDFPYDAMLAVVDRLENVGVRIRRLDPAEDVACCRVNVTCDRLLKPVFVTTQPHPGFPTDLQAQMMVLLCLAEGNSVITEKIYPERFMHVAELARMGAQLFRQGPTVIVNGVRRLVGAPVMASDLRGSACLVLAGLAAEGETVVSRVYHLDRGYAHLETTLAALGARIERFNPDREEEQAIHASENLVEVASGGIAARS